MKLERLGNIGEFINGAAFKPEDWASEGYKIIRIQNLTDPSKPYNRTTRVPSEKYIVRKGDVLVSWSATIDVFEWQDEDALLNQHIFKVVFDTAKVEKGYFVFALRKTIQDLSKFAHGSTMKHVVKKDFDNHKIPLPSLPEQIRISTLLSKAEALITQRKESIKLLDEYVKSVFAEMFGDPVKNEKGWKKMNLSQVCNKITDGTHFSPPIVETGKPYLTAKHVRENKIDFWANPWFISEENHAEIYKRCDPKKGDVIYIKDGATTGFAAVNKYDFEFSMLSSLALLRTEINICLPVYLCYWLNNKSVKEQVLKMMAGGAIQRLTLKKINEIKILIPPIELQKKFNKIVEKADILNDQLKISLEYLEDLFSSISQKAFKGDLDLISIKSNFIDEKIEKFPKSRKQAGIVDKQPKTDNEDTRYGDPFEVDEPTAKKQGAWFYNEWLRVHGKTNEEENESVWLQSKRSGLRQTTIKFNSFEGDAIIHEFFSKQHAGFGFKEFESLLKIEKITYSAKEIKEFIFQKLEQKELVQYYASKEWMEAMCHPQFNPPGGPEFSGEGSIWFLVNKTDKAK